MPPTTITVERELLRRMVLSLRHSRDSVARAVREALEHLLANDAIAADAAVSVALSASGTWSTPPEALTTWETGS